MRMIDPARDRGRCRRPRRTRRCTAATRGARTYAKNADSRRRTPIPSIARSMRHVSIIGGIRRERMHARRLVLAFLLATTALAPMSAQAPVPDQKLDRLVDTFVLDAATINAGDL